MSGKYDDMLYLPHHVSPTRPRMSMQERAAQFSPFAALTGFHAAINETARATEQKPELEEDALAELDRRMQVLEERLKERPVVGITWFRPDKRKRGRACVRVTDVVKKLDERQRVIVLERGDRIPIDDILSLEGEVFEEL